MGVSEKPLMVSHLVQNDEFVQVVHTLKESHNVQVPEALKK